MSEEMVHSTVKEAEDAEHDYNVVITVKMPGQTRESSYQIVVRATCNLEAMAKGEDEWKRATEPRDVRVKLA